MFNYLRLLPLAGLLVLGCTGPTPPTAAPIKPEASVDKAKLLLEAEPAGAKGVIEVRKNAKDGEEVAVVGRIGGDKKNSIVAGRLAFTIVDPSLKPCNEIEGDNCDTPWDYCCEAKEILVPATVMIKFVDGSGKTLSHDAKSFLGIKPLDTVVVRGKMKREGETIAILGSQLYVKPAAKPDPGTKKP